jgi:phosphopentomutase
MRAVVIVLDSCGLGELPDASVYGDEGSNSIGNVAEKMGGLYLPNLSRCGLGNIIKIKGVPETDVPLLSFGKMACRSAGKDSTIGHWEHFGIITEKPFPTYPDGFPNDLISEFENQTGKKVIGNKAASGTEIIKELGENHIKSGDLIVYTSADSVFQIAAHEDIVALDDLYKYCKIARKMLTGEHNISRVIARPFVGQPGNFTRTSNRHDYSLEPPTDTGLNIIKKNDFDVISIGKIFDLFAGSGITKSIPTVSNEDGIEKLIDTLSREFNGLTYINLVDFDMLWGHRNDYKGFAGGLEFFDSKLNLILDSLIDGDLFLISADHGCDPTTPSTDHSREFVPVLAGIAPFQNPGSDLKIRDSFADLGATVLEYLNLDQRTGKSFLRSLV